MQQATVLALSAYLILLPVLYYILSRRRVRFMGLGWVLSAPATTYTINSGSQALPRLPLSTQMDNHQGVSLLQVGRSILACQEVTLFMWLLVRVVLTLWNLL